MVAEEQEQYFTCPATLVQYDDGSRGWVVRWTLSADERKRIAAGADLYLSTPTVQLPPHNLELRPPWAGPEI